MRLHADVDGPPDGAPVVFLHGVSGSTRTYAWLTGALRSCSSASPMYVEALARFLATHA